ncbi:MAG: hypothetical protein JW867_05230 [Candidatus Omnitrophica bacterium]|nr:hypothetical protein [Candidatus Omnitrophota bacterium]
MKEFDQLVKTIKTLRSPGGCPWDIAQTKDNMKHYLIEEVYELIEAMSAAKVDSVKEELGDIFLILIVITQMCQEDKDFTLRDTLQAVNYKLISRHPHVFSNKKLRTKEEVLSYWIKNKAKAKKRKSVLNRLPKTAPSLVLANIFFKECKHIKDQKQFFRKKAYVSEKFLEYLGKAGQARDKKDIFSKLLFEFCRIAFEDGLDLELGLRHEVLKQAKKVKYPKEKK